MIKERDSLNDSLKATEHRLTDFAQAASDYFWEMDQNLRFSYFSERFREVTGVAPEMLIGKTRAETGIPDVEETAWQRHLSDLAAHRPFHDFEHPRTKPDGEVVWLSINGEPIIDQDGNFKGYRGTGIDITERRQAEQELRKSEILFRAFIDNSPAEIFMTDLQGRYVLLNRAWQRVQGLTSEEAVGLRPHEIFPAERADMFVEQQRWVLETGQVFDQEIVSSIPGITKSLHIVKFPLVDANGVTIGVGGVSTDTTARAEAEEQLRQAQKMEAMGQLTGGVAHDFNNVLATVIGNVELLEDSLAANDSRRDLAQTAIKAAGRGADLTHRLLAFSRKQALQPLPVSADKLIQGMLDLLRRTLGETIEIELVRDAGLWLTEIDPGELENAILNLAINARDAMPDGGKLMIEESNARLNDDYAAAQAEVEPGQYVLVAVTDTGSGMPPQVRERVFEPFFTTKEVGKGTGLGLSMVYGFVKQSGGHVTIYSEVGEGTTIKLYLPRYKGDHAAIEEREPVEEVKPAKGEVILVVEDDPDLRILLVHLLETLGYGVLPAATGKEALKILQETSQVNLLVTDMVLPGGMGGAMLASRVEELHPGLPVLYMSGYTENAIIHHGRLDEGVELLQKPFRKTDLARKVREALDRTKP
jgi:PAS domain S-box-containing protein